MPALTPGPHGSLDRAIARCSDPRRRGRTREQLYNEARKLGIEGRSKTTKRQHVGAVEGRKGD